jgi:hypoxanthine phosphoribosyltransferase
MDKRKISFQEFQNHIAKICRDITLSEWRPELVVGIGRGGLLPAVMISHYFGVKMNSLDISLRDGGDTVSNLGLAQDAFEGQRILVVDDINDTGATFNWLMDDWRGSCLPDEKRWDNLIWNYNIRFAVVFDNLASECRVKMDYCGEEINKAEKDVWIDFPYEEWWTK